jgi:LacI family transcriptional regulator
MQKRMRERVTVKDVARLAGVSVATVSYVMNRKRFVSPELTSRVHEAMAALDYHPSGLARGLRLRRTHCVGLVLSDITNPFFPEIARGVQDTARTAHYHVFLCNTDDVGDEVQYYVQALRAQHVDGIIFTAVRQEDVPVLRQLRDDAMIPFVLVNRRVHDLPCDFVGIDNEGSAMAMTEHLIALGYERIGFITGPESSSASAGRLNGYRAALQAHGIALELANIQAGDLTPDSGYRAAQRLLNLPHRPRAIFAANDAMALGALDALYDAGLRVPADVAVAGFDDMAFASSRTISLTTIHQSRYDLGRDAMTLLLESIEQGRTEPREVILPTRLVVRRSCGGTATE